MEVTKTKRKARRIWKHDIPLEEWSHAHWGLFYKELILAESRRKDDEPMDWYTARLIVADMYFRYPNYSTIARELNLSARTISKYVKWVIGKFTI